MKGKVHHLATFNPSHSVREILDELITHAILTKVSDIHFEPSQHFFCIRLRKDGQLITYQHLPTKLASPITTRLKIIANLDITERRLPQDGQGTFEYQSRLVHLRISCCPMAYGEKTVIRILDPHTQPLKLEQLGLEKSQYFTLKKYIKKNNGLILVVGPTGSGKTLTLYSAIQTLNIAQRNIVSCEDPIEINLTGLNQLQVNLDIELSFARALRAFLRQDPDLIMIGEIRDNATADIACKAAMTGHLILSTLHASNGIEAIYRLRSLGIESYKIKSALKLIVAQRLIRKLCTHCKHKRQASIKEKKYFKLPHYFAVYDPIGCQYCEKGYHERTGIFEILALNHKINHQLIYSKDFSFKYIMREQNQLTLKQAALRKVAFGVTSLSEIQTIL